MLVFTESLYKVQFTLVLSVGPLMKYLGLKAVSPSYSFLVNAVLSSSAM